MIMIGVEVEIKEIHFFLAMNWIPYKFRIRNSMKEHKRKKDVDHDAIFDAIKKAKDDAKRVKQLRKDLQEAEAKAHDAKEALENIKKKE